jgi:hypothetical protein
MVSPGAGALGIRPLAGASGLRRGSSGAGRARRCFRAAGSAEIEIGFCSSPGISTELGDKFVEKHRGQKTKISRRLPLDRLPKKQAKITNY